MGLDIPKNLRQATPAKLASLYQWLMDHKNYNNNIAPKKQERYQRIAESILRHIGTDRLQGIDIGCGSGTLGRMLEQHHSITYVDHARSPLIPDLAVFKKCMAWDVGDADKAYDFAISIDVLEHLHKENVIPAIAELGRLARKNVFILTTSASHTRSYGLKIQSLHLTVESQRWWQRIIKKTLSGEWNQVECIVDPGARRWEKSTTRMLWVLARS